MGPPSYMRSVVDRNVVMRHSSATLTEVFPCFFLSCKANARVKPAKMGHGTHSSKIFLLLYVLFVLCRFVYCLCIYVYCTTATGWLPNCSLQIYHIISYHTCISRNRVIQFIVLPDDGLVRPKTWRSLWFL
jgi:hypothetical protein